MANTITGKIIAIGQTQQIPSKNGGNPFLKREIVLDATRFDPYTGERGFENTPSLEFSGERCAELDNYRVGQVVTISFDLQGRLWEKDGVKKYITSIRAYKIEARSVQQQAQPQPVQQVPQAPPQRNYMQQPPQQSYQPQPQNYPPQGFPPQVDNNGLPF